MAGHASFGDRWHWFRQPILASPLSGIVIERVWREHACGLNASMVPCEACDGGRASGCAWAGYASSRKAAR
eukprot:5187735-Alexandrium_andersonii.AAC.1